ncbi:hypothetical protein IJ732_06850, partial [bacterium]|nr:hypothetical protein [bacterium]
CGKYILTYHKLFDGLINNCTAYENGECSQCENGYQNNGTSCRDIRENTCATYSGTTCTKCTSDNLLAAGECIAASTQNCAETDGLSTCTSCSNGNYLKDGGCNENPSFAKAVSENGTKVTLNDDTVADLYQVDGKYVALVSPSDYHSSGGDFREEGIEKCSQNGMRLATTEEALNIQNKVQTHRQVISSSSFPKVASGSTDANGNSYWCDGSQNGVDDDGYNSVGLFLASTIGPGYVSCSWSDHSGNLSDHGILCVKDDN